jgi:hypothetical protein
MENNLAKLFNAEKPIIGMIHLAGSDSHERIQRGLEELMLYDKENVNGAIIEDYHGTSIDVYGVLKESQKLKLKIVKGVNVLRDPYSAFELASNFGAKFIQFDSVQTRDLNLKIYSALREQYPKISVLGGVGFKYTLPTGNPLEQDLEEGMQRCEAIVTTGAGTGIETPIEKLKAYKKILGNFPLIVGAGVNADNIKEQLSVADGAIIGSYFKPEGNTFLPVDRKLVRNIVNLVK